MKKEKFLEAIYKTYEHIKELYSDAEFLLENGKKERAYTFYHFAFEESGRYFILLKILYKYLLGEIEATDLNHRILKDKGYKKHIEKLEEATFKMFMYEMLNPQNSLDKIENWYNEIAKDIPKYNDNKNKSIYICIEDNDFKSPKEMITDENIWEMKKLAEISILNIEKLMEEASFPKIEEDLKDLRKRLIEEKQKREGIK